MYRGFGEKLGGVGEKWQNVGEKKFNGPNIMGPNHLWGEWAIADLPQPFLIFKICRVCTNCRPNFVHI